MLKNQVRKQWVIFTVANVTSAEIKPRIEFKIPANVECVEGIMFSGLDTSAAPNVGVFAADAKGNILGVLSLHVNGKQAHPLHWNVRLKNPSDKKRKYETLRLDTELKGNTLLHGYFIDAGNANVYPYDLKIYLRCKSVIPLEECSTD